MSTDKQKLAMNTDMQFQILGDRYLRDISDRQTNRQAGGQAVTDRHKDRQTETPRDRQGLRDQITNSKALSILAISNHSNF